MEDGGNITLQQVSDGNILDSLYDEKKEIDYEQVQATANRILSGEIGIKRLKGAGEQGRIDGGRLLVGSSLVVGGKTSPDEAGGSQKRRNREEELLEGYAKNQNAWIFGLFRAVGVIRGHRRFAGQALFLQKF